MYEREERNLYKLTSTYSRQGSKQGRGLALGSGLGDFGGDRKGSISKGDAFGRQVRDGDRSVMSGRFNEGKSRTTGRKPGDRTTEGSVLRMGTARQHKMSISEKSEENKSAQSEIKHKQDVLNDMKEFQFGTSGLWGGDSNHDKNLYETIRNIAQNKNTAKNLTMSMVKPQDQSPHEGFIEPDELSELEPRGDGKMALYNKLLNNYAVDMLINLKIINETLDEFVLADTNQSDETQKIVIILLENLKQIILRFEYFKKSF